MGRIDLIMREFIGRLARDARGNTLAIMAAALIPLAGLIGGGVDMSRLYLTKTRMQQACDAGALAGRKAMGPNAWTTGSGNGSTNDKAESMFKANFASGQYGTSGVIPSYSESSGTVAGSAQATVPMTIMKIFGITTRTISVTCNAKMEIPNTDVMFVLDVTGSMNCAPGTNCNNSTPVSGAKITGLKSAVKCFYEALEKVNTTEVCGNDPTATSATTTAQIRFGFVPYTVNVNVGRLLPNSYMADNWTYQSRVAVGSPQSVWAYTLGTQTATTSNLSATPSTYASTSAFNSFTTVSSSSYTMADGTIAAKNPTAANTSAKCSALNTYLGGSQMVGIQESNGSWSSSTTTPSDNNPPVYATSPPVTQHISVTRTRTNTVNTGFKYTWTSGSCYLQSASAKTGSNANKYTQTDNGTASKSITWTQYNNVITSWIYKATPLDVSGLKAGGSNWNNSISLPIGDIGTSVTLSGSSTSTLVYTPNGTVNWDGCIEERNTTAISDTTQTAINADFATIPANDYDLNIDMLPSASTVYNSFWGPALDDATWARTTVGGSCSGSDTLNPTTTNCNLPQNFSYYCPTAASRLTTYTTAPNFEAYVNGLSAGGNTYHDIGLLWGARLLSPTGMFASSNATTPGGQAIQRNMIFMTDGATQTDEGNYTAYGVGWWNRKQTTYAPSSTTLNLIVNARTDALCTAIKNMNVTLWVVSFGGGVDAPTETRLSNCATPGHYYSASDNATLLANFRDIASKISELRLTS